MSETRTAVITGASAGIGKAAARVLLAQGWRVIGVGRDAARCAAAEAELAHPRFTLLRADMAFLAQAARVADDIAALAPRVDALLNNAGGVCAERIVTAEGHEATFAGNHLAPFVLTHRLLPQLRAAVVANGEARVIAVSSTGHEHCPAIRWDDLTFAEDYSGGAAYCHAKLANILFARELARRAGGDGVVSHAMHPGVVASNFASHCEPAMRDYMTSILDRSRTPEAAADTLVWLASDAAPGACTARYWHDRAEQTPAAAALDDASAARLWTVSEALAAPYLSPRSSLRRSAPR